MDKFPVSLQTSYISDIILLLIALLFIASIFYFYLRKPKQKKNSQSLETQTEFLTKKDDIPQQSKAEALEKRVKTTPPHTFKKTFEETPNVTVDDFFHFKGAHLLVVEDNKINQKILIDTLKRSGIDLTIANNGQEALEYLYDPDMEFDLVLMDISMPVMDGCTATKKIREDSRFDTLPIVTLTASAIPKEIERMFETGINGHLNKPLNNRQLYTVFQTYLGHLKRPVSAISSLKMKGLDIQLGIIQAQGDEKVYQQMLREFIFLYGTWGKQMPIWIDNKEYDLIKHSLIKIGSKLGTLGAYELDELVARMKKTFIYGTEHRIDEFKDLFSEKLNRLIIAMRLYLQDDLL